jgi:hypothetical protein
LVRFCSGGRRIDGRHRGVGHRVDNRIPWVNRLLGDFIEKMFGA